MPFKILVTGWFSFEQMGATAGDLLARDLVCEWLDHAGYAYDVAIANPFSGGIDWRVADPNDYSHIVFVCGPFGNGWPITDLLQHFNHSYLIGLDISMLEPLDAWNPFDLLLERDSSATSRPEIVFLSNQAHVPVVGVVLVHPQQEYKERGMHELANESIWRLLQARETSVVRIDTRLDTNNTGLHSPAEVESLISRMDLVVTTRLHGMILALKNGVPAVVIDPIAGGAKVLRQARTIGWPVIFTADVLTDEELGKAFNYCLTNDARSKAIKCAERATMVAQQIRAEFTSALARLDKEIRG